MVGAVLSTGGDASNELRRGESGGSPSAGNYEPFDDNVAERGIGQRDTGEDDYSSALDTFGGSSGLPFLSNRARIGVRARLEMLDVRGHERR